MVPPNRLQPAPLFFSGILSPDHRRAPHPRCTRTPGAATRTCWTAGSRGGGSGGGTRRPGPRSRSPRASWSPSRAWALARLGPRLRSAKLLRLATALALSGFLHACASYTQLGPTRPLRGPFCFFVLRAAGVAAETLLARFLGAGEGVWRRLSVGVCACVVLIVWRRCRWTILRGTGCGCTSRSLSVRCVRWGSASGAMGGGAGVGSGCICIWG